MGIMYLTRLSYQSVTSVYVNGTPLKQLHIIPLNVGSMCYKMCRCAKKNYIIFSEFLLFEIN